MILNLMQVITDMCGAELTPHATLDGQPAPVVCTAKPHQRGTFHYNHELDTSWQDV